MPRIIAVIIELVIFVCALWLLTFLSSFLHELGHALGYMVATGDRHWNIRVGFGKRLLNTKRFTFGLLPFDGFFTPLGEKKIDTAAKLIATLSGGPALSLILVVGLLLLRFGGITFDSEVITADAIVFFINTALYINLFIFVLSLLPTHYFLGEIKGLETDGLQIINAIKRQRRNDNEET